MNGGLIKMDDYLPLLVHIEALIKSNVESTRKTLDSAIDDPTQTVFESNELRNYVSARFNMRQWYEFKAKIKPNNEE